MERLSHDLNLALDESNCGIQSRKKFGLRRRTRSTGNLPSACLSGVIEDCSSSSPPQIPVATQPLSDSDDPHLNQIKQGGGGAKMRSSHFCPVGNFESDSFNENFSPTRPPNARRKRKFKKMAIDCTNSNHPSSPREMIDLQVNLVPSSLILHSQGSLPLAQINKKKRIFKHIQDRSTAFCGKRKWSHRDRSDVGEMRERSFSGGCTSKSYFFGKNYLEFKNGKKYATIDKIPKFKEKLVTVGKTPLSNSNIDCGFPKLSLTPNFTATPTLPGSSSFNFVYKSGTGNSASKVTGFKVATYLPPFFPKAIDEVSTSNSNAATGSSASLKMPHMKSHRCKAKGSHHLKVEGLRNPLEFDDPGNIMDCTGNEFLSSSSLSSSDSEGVVTNDSDREGDDELTDWPGNDEISTFNKSLNFKNLRLPNNGSTKIFSSVGGKTSKKEKYLPKHGASSCKNKSDIIKSDVTADADLMIDDDTMMSDTGSVLDITDGKQTLRESPSNIFQPNASFSSFSDIKNAGLNGQNTNEAFFHSFQAYQDKSSNGRESQPFYSATPRSNFSLQKTSSSDLNLSEKSPQSDHYFSEHSMGNFMNNEVREIRAGCRRIHDERPSLLIQSAANEQLSKFLQDSCQSELRLPCFNDDIEEREKLDSLAKLYSLELKLEMGRPILRKTSKTTQALRVEQTRLHQAKFLSDYKRRCYGDDIEAEFVDSLDPTLFPESITDDWSQPSDGHSMSSTSCLDRTPGCSEDTRRDLIPPDIAISACADIDEDIVEAAGGLRPDMNFTPDLLSNIPINPDFTKTNINIGHH